MTQRIGLMMIGIVGVTFLGEGRAEDRAERRPLWPDGAPAAVGEREEDRPTLDVYLPEPGRGNGAAVVICPGGGYANLALEHEGRQVAEWFNSFGVAAFVLRYRLGPRYRHPVPLGDALRGIRYVRHHAGEFRVDPERVGIMGFSAGGHLASTAATLFEAGEADAADPIERQPSRPDFAILCYPVISFTAEYTHAGSRGNLLGEDPDAGLVEALSTETRITERTPPTFLFHTDGDEPVPPENSVAFYLGLRAAGVPAELHVYRGGRHGMGLGLGDPAITTWPKLLANWMRESGLLGEGEEGEEGARD